MSIYILVYLSMCYNFWLKIIVNHFFLNCEFMDQQISKIDDKKYKFNLI